MRTKQSILDPFSRIKRDIENRDLWDEWDILAICFFFVIVLSFLLLFVIILIMHAPD